MEARVAVCLYGFLRTCENARYSLLKHVVEQNKADVFLYAPEQVGALNLKFDKTDNKDAYIGQHIDDEHLIQWYGTSLRRYKLWTYSEDLFSEQASKQSIPCVAEINPVRVFSMFYHMKQSLMLLQEYEKEQRLKYEAIVLTRPDIAFYSPIDVSALDLEKIQIPFSTGKFDGGRMRGRNAAVLSYRNVVRGECILEGANTFNDQIIVGSRDHILLMSELYDNLSEYIQFGVPFNPETLIYYHLVLQHGLTIKNGNKWIYELLRNDLPIIYPTCPSPVRKENIKFRQRLKKRIGSIFHKLSPCYGLMEENNRLLRRQEGLQREILSQLKSVDRKANGEEIS